MRVALLLSLCIHAAILAIHFSHRPPAPPDRTLEVVLVNARTRQAPIKPRLAAQNQINGGGNAAAGHASSPLPRTTDQSPDQVVLAALRKRQSQLEQEQQQLFVQLQSKQQALLARVAQHTPQESSDTGADDLDQESRILNAQISALKAAIERYNAQPRQQFVAPSTQSVPYAQYVEAWRKRIELLGTEHYPEQARGKVYGQLQMTVYIGRNGELLRMEIDKPSKYAILNSAARRIVQLAAPFPPLPDAIARHTDVLAITRTWHFVNSQLTGITP